MEKYENKHMRQIEHAAQQWEGRESKSKNNTMRKQWLDHQTHANYRNEYDRIRGELSHDKITYESVKELQKRESVLKRLFSSGIV